MFTPLRMLIACAALGLLAASNASAGGSPNLVAVPKPKEVSKYPPKINGTLVSYRSSNPQTKAFRKIADAQAFQMKLRNLGFRAIIVRHISHSQVRYELDDWRQKVFHGALGHIEAHALETWLKAIGAETKLVHQ